MAKYPIYLGVMVFGQSSPENIDNVIAEFKLFIETNSNFILNLEIIKSSNLSNSEIQFWNTATMLNCYFHAPWNLFPANVALFPKNVLSNIVLYNYNNLTPVCLLGGTWGRSVGVNGVAYSAVPIGYDVGPFAPWTYHRAQIIAHEWLNALNTIFVDLGYMFLTPESCPAYGYNISNGWKDCYAYILSTITDAMYQKLACAQPQVNINVQ